jgi:hypothetical protein
MFPVWPPPIVIRDVVLQGRRSAVMQLAMSPGPVPNFRQIFAESIDVLTVLDQLVFKLLLQVDPFFSGLRYAIDDIHDRVEAVQFVQDGDIEWRRNRSLFFVPTNMNILMNSSKGSGLIVDISVASFGEFTL